MPSSAPKPLVIRRRDDAAIVESYLRYLALERGRSANTISAYRGDLLHCAQWLAAETTSGLVDATSEDIARYAAMLAGSPTSQQRRLSSLRNFFEYLVVHQGASANPAREIRGPRAPGRLPKALSVQSVGHLLESISADDPVSIRDRALLELLYATGARVSEVANLALDDVHSPNGGAPELLRVIGKGDKERIVPLGSHARAAVEAYLVRSRPVLATRAKKSVPTLFLGSRGGPLSRQSIWLVLRSRAHKAGITEELSPHTLRHSCATHLVAGGADIRVVQELLGHQSVQTTQIYTKVTIDSLRDVYYTSHPRARA